VATWNNASLATPNLLAAKLQTSVGVAKASQQSASDKLQLQTLKMTHNLSLTMPQPTSLAAK
jgi:hypothetical protein